MATYIPKTPPVFDSDKPLPIYTYEDDNVKCTQNFKFGLLWSLFVQPTAYSYYYFGSVHVVAESTGALVLGLLGTAMMLAVPMGARGTITAINLHSSGQKVLLHTGTLTGVQLGRSPVKHHSHYEYRTSLPPRPRTATSCTGAGGTSYCTTAGRFCSRNYYLQCCGDWL